MRAISSLVKKLAANYPDLKFAIAKTAHWSSTEKTVYYNPEEPHASWTLLHETAHALLNHDNYCRDIDLLKMERDAWNYANGTLAPVYGIAIATNFIEVHLDTYRDWLHAKSTCPTCSSTGFEHRKHSYRCLHCGSAWRTNAGTAAQIRRYVTTK